MSDAVQLGAVAHADEEQATGDPTPPLGRFEVVPTKSSAPEELFSFRKPEPPPEPPAAAPPPKSKMILMAIAGVALVAALLGLIVIGTTTAIEPKPPVQYIDLGTQRFDPAGLGGRLIVRWEGNAEYQLSLDPLEQGFVPRFEAVAQNPPRPLSLTLRLRDAAGIVLCQKEVLFPPPAPEGTVPDAAQLLQPQRTPSGDTVQNVAGEDGQIGEIAASGGLPCSAKAYARLVAWDFSTNFPTLDEQDAWLRHEGTVAPHQKHRVATGFMGQVQRLPTTIEGDDVIVGDNPTRGTVETSAGRLFLVASNASRNRGSEWQVFPAAIHFRCDKSGLCLLTRANSHATLPARLLK